MGLLSTIFYSPEREVKSLLSRYEKLRQKYNSLNQDYLTTESELKREVLDTLLSGLLSEIRSTVVLLNSYDSDRILRIHGQCSDSYVPGDELRDLRAEYVWLQHHLQPHYVESSVAILLDRRLSNESTGSKTHMEWVASVKDRLASYIIDPDNARSPWCTVAYKIHMFHPSSLPPIVAYPAGLLDATTLYYDVYSPQGSL